MDQQISDQLQACIVQIYTLGNPENTLGTGFWLTDQLIVTCYHILPIEIQAKQSGEIGYCQAISGYGGIASLEFHERSKELDIAILRVCTLQQNRITPILPISPNIIYGNPFRSFGFRKIGYFKGLDTKGEIRTVTLAKKKDGVWAEVIQLSTSEIDNGMSGAPIYDLVQEKIVGIVSSHWQTSKTVDGFLAFGIPISKIREIMPNINQSHPEIDDRLVDVGGKAIYKPFPTHLPLPYFIPRVDARGRDIANEIVENLQQRKHHIITIWGAGGVGKTTLALEIARRVFPLPFTDGIIWSSADGRLRYGLDTLLDDILDNCKKEQLKTLSLENKIDYVNNHVKDKKFLLVLDNYETISDLQITHFLANLPTQIIVTSRIQTEIIGEKTYLLRKMNLQEAQEFIDAEITNLPNPDRLRNVNIDTVMKIGDGNPMIIRWAIGLIEHFYTPEDILYAMQFENGDASERVFGRTYDLLKSKSKSILLSLSLFVPSCDPSFLESIFNIKRSEMVNHLSVLSRYALVETEVDSGRIWLVALTRQLANNRLRKDIRLFKRISNHFVESFLGFVEHQVSQSPRNFDHIKSEEKNILAAMDIAIEIGKYDAVFQFVKLLGRGLGFLDLDSSWREVMLRIDSVLRKFDVPTEHELVRATAFEIGRGYYHIGNYELAKIYYQLALEGFRLKNDTSNIVFVILHLGRQARNCGQYNEALKYFEDGLQIAIESGDYKNQGIILNELGAMAMRRGEYEKANHYLTKCLEVKKQVGDPNAIAISQYQLGNYYLITEQYDDAYKYYQSAMEVFRSVRNNRDMASCLGQLAWIERGRKNYSESRKLLLQSEKLFNDLGDEKGLSRIQYYLGRIDLDEEKADEAEIHFQISLNHAFNLQNPELIAYATYGLGLLQIKLNISTAIDYLSKSKKMFDDLHNPMYREIEILLSEISPEK